MTMGWREDWDNDTAERRGHSVYLDDGTAAEMHTTLAIMPRCLRCGSPAALVHFPLGSACLPTGSDHYGKCICVKCLDALLAQGCVKLQG